MNTNNTYAYGRVSSKDQNEIRQIEAFHKLGINNQDVYLDKQSGKDFNRENYQKLKRKLRPNDF